MVKLMELKSTGQYPCQWNDIIDNKRRTYVTVYTLKNAREDGIKRACIKKARDGVFDIVIDTSQLTKKIIVKALEDLSKITEIKYNLSY